MNLSHFYNDIAGYYELWSKCDPAEKPTREFYSRQALKHGGPVLEVGGGTGRITFAIAELGIPITAVETSAAMLSIASHRLSNASSLVKQCADLVESDILAFTPVEPVRLVIIPFRTIGHFLTRESRFALLQKAWSVLQPGGHLILDHFTLKETTSPEVREVRELIAGSIGNTDFRLIHSHTYDTMTGQFHCELSVISLPPAHKTPLEETYRYKLASLPVQEFQELLSSIGFELVTIYGSFEQEEFTPFSKEQVWIIRKPNSLLKSVDNEPI